MRWKIALLGRLRFRTAMILITALPSRLFHLWQTGHILKLFREIFWPSKKVKSLILKAPIMKAAFTRFISRVLTTAASLQFKN